jgi:prepilin-type N-terminal cleavage/methylation domain-containing protein
MIAQAMKSSKKAFTLVELIVVITILAILATIGFLSLQGYTKDARNSSTKANIRTAVSAIANESAVSTYSPLYYITQVQGNMKSNSNTASIVVYSGQLATGTTTPQTASGNTYAAGTINFSAVRLDPTKFVDNNNNFLAGAVSVMETVNGKNRARQSFQVAGTIDEGAGSKAYVMGNYGSGATGDANGLIYSNNTAVCPNNTTAIADGSLTCYPYAY